MFFKEWAHVKYMKPIIFSLFFLACCVVLFECLNARYITELLLVVWMFQKKKNFEIISRGLLFSLIVTEIDNLYAFHAAWSNSVNLYFPKR